MELPKDVTGWLGTAALGLAGWLWRQISAKASKDELAAAMKRVDEHLLEAKASREDIRDTLDDTVRIVNKTANAVARIEGRLGVAGDP